MVLVFFIIWQCLQANEFDIYEVLGDAPKQRSLGVNHSSNAREPHYSKFHSCFFSVIKEIFQVQSFLFGVWVLFIPHAQNTTSQATSSQGALCSLLSTINNLVCWLPLLGCPSGNVATTHPHCPLQFQGLCFWLLGCLILSEVPPTIYFLTNMRKGKGKG